MGSDLIFIAIYISRCPSHYVGYHEPFEILKENDLRGKTKILLSYQEAMELTSLLETDAKWLSSQNLMDYSLLGIAD